MAGAPKENKNASKFDMDIVMDICSKIADGHNIKEICKNDSRIHYDTFRRWKRDNTVVYDLYIKAIQDKADSVDAKIDEIWEGCRKGQYDASTANVLIQTLKWKAAKYYPKMFGDRQEIKHDVSDVKPLEFKIVKK